MQSILKFLYISIAVLPLNLIAYEVKQTVFAFWDKPDVVLHYKTPVEINNETKIIFIIHGQSRNVDSYINHWVGLVGDKNVLLIAPEFTKEDYRYFGLLQTATSNGAIKTDSDMYLTNSIDTFFSFFKSKFDLESSKYSIFGHSAGGQFTHRYLLLSNKPNIDKAVIANPGWYTFLAGAKYPYGIKDIPIGLSSDSIKSFLSMRNTLLLGSDDTGSSGLNTSPGAMKQGDNRFVRGNNYFSSLVELTSKNSIPLRWNYEIVDGAGHDFRKMSNAAANILL